MNTNGASWRNRAPLIRSGESNRDRRRRNGGFWGASEHSPIISQRKTNPSSSAVTHMYAASLAKDKTWSKATTVKGKCFSQTAGFYKAQLLCVFFSFSLQSKKIVWATEIRCCEHQVGLLKSEERKPQWQLFSLLFFGPIFFSSFWVWCSRASALSVTHSHCRRDSLKAWDLPPGEEEARCSASIVAVFIYRDWKKKILTELTANNNK